jgi:rhodanese-related sulfurtransferase
VGKSDALHGLLVALEQLRRMFRHNQALGGVDMKDVRVLSTAELQQGIDRDSGLHVLNVQTDEFFAGELIPGSRRIPLDAIEQGVKEVPKDAEIVTYCAGPACSQSTQAAQKLTDLGYTNVRAYSDGLEGWKAAGRETVQLQPIPAA